jgi:mRNA-degrading endonuclease toxin of MazEF toxin-antitoxin module
VAFPRGLAPGDIIVMLVAGEVEEKPRPVVVISTQQYLDRRPDVTFGLLTTQLHQATTEFDYILKDWRAVGLARPSAFRSYFATRAQGRALQYIGRLSDRDWAAVQACVRQALETWGSDAGLG